MIIKVYSVFVNFSFPETAGGGITNTATFDVQFFRLVFYLHQMHQGS